MSRTSSKILENITPIQASKYFIDASYHSPWKTENNITHNKNKLTDILSLVDSKILSTLSFDKNMNFLLKDILS